MISDIVLLVASISALIGAIGVLRFRDCYMRSHAATMVSMGGVMLALAALALETFGTVYFVKIILIIIFFMVTNPVSSHAILNAAHKVGIEPVIIKKKRRSKNAD